MPKRRNTKKRYNRLRGSKKRKISKGRNKNRSQLKNINKKGGGNYYNNNCVRCRENGNTGYCAGCGRPYSEGNQSNNNTENFRNNIPPLYSGPPLHPLPPPAPTVAPPNYTLPHPPEYNFNNFNNLPPRYVRPRRTRRQKLKNKVVRGLRTAKRQLQRVSPRRLYQRSRIYRARNNNTRAVR